jgi:acyl-CoA hydrolase
MDRIDFKTRVVNGSILRLHVDPWKQGTTSVTYSVDVFADEPGASTEKHVFSTHVTLACVDEEGHKRELPKIKKFSSEPNRNHETEEKQ